MRRRSSRQRKPNASQGRRSAQVEPEIIFKSAVSQPSRWKVSVDNWRSAAVVDEKGKRGTLPRSLPYVDLTREECTTLCK